MGEKGKETSKKILKAIIDFFETYNYPPTIRDISEMTDISIVSVHKYINILREQGYIDYDSCTSRSIQVKGYKWVKVD